MSNFKIGQKVVVAIKGHTVEQGSIGWVTANGPDDSMSPWDYYVSFGSKGIYGFTEDELELPEPKEEEAPRGAPSEGIRTMTASEFEQELTEARAEGWDVCSRAVEAATRLVAPDHITPMGKRMIVKAARNNPYTPEKK